MLSQPWKQRMKIDAFFASVVRTYPMVLMNILELDVYQDTVDAGF